MKPLANESSSPMGKSNDQLCITIQDPAEGRELLISSIASALRWYALTPDKRKGDEEKAVVLIDLMEELHRSN